MLDFIARHAATTGPEGAVAAGPAQLTVVFDDFKQQVFTVTLPPTMIVAVADTTPSVKGIPNATKDAVLENGITIKVGLFINVGDRLKIDTETLEVKERVNS